MRRCKSFFALLASLVSFLSLFICLSAHSAESESPVPSIIYLSKEAEDRLALDPRLSLSMSTHYFSVDGIAYAREQGVKSFTMSPLDLRSEMGVRDILIYDFELDWRVSLRNHINVEYLFGQQSDSGYISSPTGFNDHYWTETGKTRGGVAFYSLQIGWNYRALDLYGEWGRYELDLGLGAMNIRSYISFAPEAHEDQLDTEQLFAPLMPYLSLRSEWRPKPKIILGLNSKYAGLENYTPDLSGLDIKPRPASGIYLLADVYAQYPINQYLNLVGGVEYLQWEVEFEGMEDDLDLARNKINQQMQGAYLGVSFNDLHEIIISTLRSFWK